MAFLEFRPKRTFCGVQYDLKESNTAIIPVPYESTTSYIPGTRFGPQAIIDASRELTLFDESTGTNPIIDIRPHTFDEVEPNVDSPFKMIERLERLISELLEADKFPVVLGGEHSISLAPILALNKSGRKFSVLHLDAHADLLNEYQGSHFSHACTARRIVEELDPTSLVLVGIRNISEEEYEFALNSGLIDNIFFAKDIRNKSPEQLYYEILPKLPDDIYITIDVDFFDPSVIPSVGTPEPGGFSIDFALSLLSRLVENKNIIGLDVVELAPRSFYDPSPFIIAKFTYQLLAKIFSRTQEQQKPEQNSDIGTSLSGMFE